VAEAHANDTLEPLDTPNSSADHSFDDDLPTAEALLARLKSIDLKKLDLDEVFSELLGDWKWARIFVMPVGALLLFLFTWALSGLFGHIVPAFALAAVFIIFLGKLIDRYERAMKVQARRVIEQRIAEIEGTDGLLIYFKDFLPQKYKPLIKALQRGMYGYIPQYIEAVTMLREQLDPVKFQTWWLIKRDKLRTLSKPVQYYINKAERLKLLSDDDLSILLEHVKEKDILNMLLLTHDEYLAQRVLSLLSLLIAQHVKTALYQVKKFNQEEGKQSIDRILKTARELALNGQLSVGAEFFD